MILNLDSDMPGTRSVWLALSLSVSIQLTLLITELVLIWKIWNLMFTSLATEVHRLSSAEVGHENVLRCIIQVYNTGIKTL